MKRSVNEWINDDGDNDDDNDNDNGDNDDNDDTDNDNEDDTTRHDYPIGCPAPNCIDTSISGTEATFLSTIAIAWAK